MFKKSFHFSLFFLLNFLLFHFPLHSENISLSDTSFTELWGYVTIGEEMSFSTNYPVSDVGYFVNPVNSYSDFPSVPERSQKFPGYKGRVHLVIPGNSAAHTHLLLDPKLPLRNKIIKRIIAETKEYDGLQIDWESVMKADDENFRTFLKILKKKLKGKTLSVAVPARVKKLERDAYDYAELSKIVDRIIVMAYDEHWSTSAPGPVASTAWCKRIMDFAKSVIPEEKLVMGCHFYARAWNNEDVGNKAYRMYKIEDIIRSNKVSDFKESDGGDLSFTFEKKTRVSVYYDTPDSVAQRCRMYFENGIKKLSFWRVGQESPEFWGKLAFKSPEPLEP